MVRRLDDARAQLDADGPLRPLHVALFGGTGVGKSSLFNALLGRPGASPESDAERCFTTVPHVAVAPADRPLVAVPDALAPVFVAGVAAGVVLIDTPDINGMLESNWEVTRQVVERSDLIVYVTSPDEVSSDAVLRQVREWAGRKQWLFAMTMMDHAEYAEMDVVRDGFDRRRRELGFAPDDGTRFLVSSRQPDRFNTEFR